MEQKIYNTIYGAIVADALGVPVEFASREERKKYPVSEMLGHGTFDLPNGSWSDDSSMTLCLAESIGRLGKIDYDDIMRNFSLWYYESKFTPDNKTFDVGRTCYAAICNYRDLVPPLNCGLKQESDNGNGSLMRIFPLPFYLFAKYGPDAMEKEESFEIIHKVSSLTHAHPISLIGCDIYCTLMIEILKDTNDTPKESLLNLVQTKLNAYSEKHPEYESHLQKYERIFLHTFKDIPEEEINSSGYIVDTLEAALWSFLTTSNYQECVLKAVNLGRDTDTVGCVAGSIAGLYYGDIPSEWIETLRNRKVINEILEKFSAAIES